MTTPVSPPSPALTAIPQKRKPGRWLLALGLALPLAGILAFIAQMSLGRLSFPKYLPAAGTAGVLLLVAALWRGRSVWRVLALAVILLLAVGEWALVVGLRLPPYAGPIVIGQSFPAFATLKTDGSQFTERDLPGNQKAVLVSFRGRW
jgi:hypothetical protein